MSGFEIAVVAPGSKYLVKTDRLKIPQVQSAAPFSSVLCSACRDLTGRRVSSWRRGGQTNAHGRCLVRLDCHSSPASPGPQHLVLSCTFITVTCYCMPCQSLSVLAILHAAS